MDEKYYPEEFQKKIKNLRNMFLNKKVDNYIFSDYDFNSNLPIDALPLYFEKIWSLIRTNHDLNIAFEKSNVSNLRCSQIKIDTLEYIHSELKSLKSSVKKNFEDNFGEIGLQILKKCFKYFDENAKFYSENVFLSKRNELESVLINELRILFNLQVYFNPFNL